MLRTLRIAVSVVSGICCVLVIVLWVWSFLRPGFTEVSGVLILPSRGTLTIYDPTPPPKTLDGNQQLFFGDASVRIPIWCLAAVGAAAAIAPWLSWRFSLRTLLIATTVVALALGLIVYATRG